MVRVRKVSILCALCVEGQGSSPTWCRPWNGRGVRLQPDLIPVLVGISLPGGPPQLVERAVGAPRVRIEAGGSRDRQHVPVRAALDVPLFGRTPPAARPELLHGGRERRRWTRGRLGRRGRGRWSERIVVHQGESALSRAEGDDAPKRIVGRNPNRDAVAGNNLDAEAPHPTAELGEHLVAGVALDPVQAAAVHGHDRALNINEIVFAQLPVLSNAKIVPHHEAGPQTRRQIAGENGVGRSFR